MYILLQYRLQEVQLNILIDSLISNNWNISVYQYSYHITIWIICQYDNMTVLLLEIFLGSR